VTGVLAAFLQHKRWSQAELARDLEISVEAVRKILRDLRAGGVPLTSREERPHVYWTLRKDWVPGGVYFKDADVPELLRQLRRLPKSKGREHLLDVLVQQLPAGGKLAPAATVVSRSMSEAEEQHVPRIEEAAARRIPVLMKYWSASSRRYSERHASVHLVDVGPPARFIATCHQNGGLRWFRVESVSSARLDEREAFRACPTEEVEEYRRSSLDGFRGDGPAMEYVFSVREPEASWVQNNLLEGMHLESRHGGIVVSVTTSALTRLARFVASLGGAARPEGRALADAVAEIARQALEQARSVLDSSAESGASEPPPGEAVRPRSDV
jgi:predicted DNA-binding transcriptional regulator YafY